MAHLVAFRPTGLPGQLRRSVVGPELSLEAGEGTMMRGQIELPADADHLALWFLNTGATGAQYWDSNSGTNFVFRFVAEDLEVESAKVTRDAHAARSWFRVAISATAEGAATQMYRYVVMPMRI